MTRKIRVLLVDDSAIVRRLVRMALAEEPDIEVVGASPNGEAALAVLDCTPVDAVVLDVEMPVLDGLATLDRLRPRWPKLPVIMFSTLTERGAATTLDALARGASDYVAKPTSTGALASSLSQVRAELAPKLRALTGARPAPRQVAAPRRAPASMAQAIVIGVSTGGPNALMEVIPRLPANLAVPVLVVQHMPPTFTRLLAERLDQASPFRVVEVDQPRPVEPGTVYLAPGGRHMTAVRSGSEVSLLLDDGPLVRSCRPSVDVLFRSAAPVWGSRLLGVVLTGMGQDGLDGARDIKGAGGSVVVQDEASSVVWGMPGAVASAGLADDILPLDRIATELARRSAVPVTGRVGR